MSVYDELKPVTESLSDAIYAALDACDAYQEAVASHLAVEREPTTPNHQLENRLRQFESRITSIVTTIEDRVLDDLNFLNHRLFAVDLTERGEFI